MNDIFCGIYNIIIYYKWTFIIDDILTDFHGATHVVDLDGDAVDDTDAIGIILGGEGDIIFMTIIIIISYYKINIKKYDIYIYIVFWKYERGK